ncbi:conserved hypothetical protein [Methylorubrum populi BJ001]|jgi:flagellar biosynthesis/type III secretory pathway protein FliH|uniref:Uncharacterized protein n=1 Tax=Methylorubrum populi (strain ATCC BAA-705 / NCIMB 13946 / BJ001) TaxID=441620 RepID=B1ZE51_METPB|nr:hypothetical protein [Methylorubrum populi]ACB78212.1 conserved hypothetical protein [Methylorubrum populi BJ001]OAH39360.1 hypothetical protein AX289_15215 [Methylorubrum populi]PZP71821.1 MAG: hypothetical protein DI590_06045 [Methylorubrum populi]
MSETVEAGKGAAKHPAGKISPEDLLRQAVTGAKADATARPRKPFRLGANGRLAAASAAALIGGLSLGLMAAPQERSGNALAQMRAELSAGRSESARLAQEIDRLARTATALREASEAARSETKALGQSLADRIGRTEQTLDKRLTALSETVTRGEREQSERIAGMIAQLEKKPQPVAAVQSVPAKPEPKPEARLQEPTQTGSLPDKPKSETLDGWALRDVYDGVAILEDRRRRLVEVGRGDAVPGVGRVEAIERRGRQWVVVTRQGVITPQAW